MGGWHRLSAAGGEGTKKLSEPARHIITNTPPASFFCAGDTLPFLAIFSKALIFFCYFFCIKAKKVNGDFEVLTSEKLYLINKKSRRSLIRLNRLDKKQTILTTFVPPYNHGDHITHEGF